MSGRKRPIGRSGNQKLNGHVYITWTGSGYKRFYNSVAQNGVYDQRHGKHSTTTSRFRNQQQDQCKHDPDCPCISQLCDRTHHLVPYWCVQLLEQIQNIKFNFHIIISSYDYSHKKAACQDIFSAKKRTYDVYISPVLIYNKNSLRQKYLKYNLKGQKIKC